MTQSLLYTDSYEICNGLSVTIPTVGQIMRDESAYYSLLSTVISTPYDYMVQLYDAGVDYTTITDYELFSSFFEGLQSMDTSLLFGDLDLTAFSEVVNPANMSRTFRDPKTGVVIDRIVHQQICAVLRKINFLQRNYKTPGNAEALRYMIERARKKQERAARRGRESQLEPLIIAMVNTEQYKYNYEETLGLSIYQFNASVHQIIKKINFDNLMIGCYAGTVDAKKLSHDELNWISQK